MKKQKNSWSRRILSGYLFIFLSLAAKSLIKKELIAIDGLIAALFCFFFILITKKYKVKTLTAFLAGFIFVPHILGNMGLYRLSMLNYHYDWIVHIVSAFCATYVLLDFLLQKKCISRKFFSVSVIALSITIAFGALVEISEYWSFRTIGIGEGYLGFGPGDNSQNFGPWENSSVDTSLNFLGSLLAIVIHRLLIIIKYFYSKR